MGPENESLISRYRENPCYLGMLGLYKHTSGMVYLVWVLEDLRKEKRRSDSSLPTSLGC